MNVTSPRSITSMYAGMFTALITYASARAIREALQAQGRPGHVHVLLLATIEIIAAVTFASRPARKRAGVVLLVVFSIAIVVTAIGRNVPANLLFYAFDVIFVLALERALPQEGSWRREFNH